MSIRTRAAAAGSAGAGAHGTSVPGQSRKRRVIASLIALPVVLVIAGSALIWRPGHGRAAPAPAAPVATVTVTRTDLSTSQTMSGTLGYGTPAPVNGGKSGILTWLPASGAAVTRGQALYRVDNVPVPVLYGHTPLYRKLNTVGMVGPDVKMIVGNLAALGYDVGYQPAAGSVITQQPAATVAHPATAKRAAGRKAAPASSATPAASAAPASSASPPVTTVVGPGDAVLTTSLIAVIRQWQAAEGMPATGVLGIGDAIVEPGPVQVASLQAQLGSQASGALMSVTPVTKIVTVNADSTGIPSLRNSGAVTITLPDNTTTAGRITAISAAVQSGQNTSDSQPQQSVTITLDYPAAAAGLTSAPVQVTFSGATRRGVLAVPVGALLALAGGGYAVQTPGGRLIPVQTGLFAQGLVQISGPGIVAGLRVVTAA